MSAGSLILDSTEESETNVLSQINDWLKGQFNQTEVINMARNLLEFWKKRKNECDRIEFKIRGGRAATATLWKIGAEYTTPDLSVENSPTWEFGRNRAPWEDSST